MRVLKKLCVLVSSVIPNGDEPPLDKALWGSGRDVESAYLKNSIVDDECVKMRL